MIEPPDPDEIFRELVEDLDIEEPKGVIDYTSLDTLDLNKRLGHIREELLSLGEMMNPRSERARELHSERSAILIEMSRRGMR